MELLKEISRETFKNKFGTEDACYEYLSNQKWSNGYSCKKCNSSKYIKGKQPYSRRCSKCGYDESTTADTLFHKLKFGIDKAFGMLYEIVTSKKGANSIWLAERFGVQQKTSWLFRQKVQIAMKSSEQYPLENNVHVDEFEIGTPQEGEQGRSKSKKKDYPNLEQTLSDSGKNFKMLHIQIRNFKNWLRGVHSYCDKQYQQRYIDEYFFRFNRRNSRSSILDKIIERFVLHEPLTYKMIKIPAT